MSFFVVADGLYFMGVSGTLFWGPYNKDPTISGTILESPYFRKLPYRVTVGPWCFSLGCFLVHFAKSWETARIQ